MFSLVLTFDTFLITRVSSRNSLNARSMWDLVFSPSSEGRMRRTRDVVLIHTGIEAVVLANVWLHQSQAGRLHLTHCLGRQSFVGCDCYYG
jgi:hypothetical protein